MADTPRIFRTKNDTWTPVGMVGADAASLGSISPVKIVNATKTTNHGTACLALKKNRAPKTPTRAHRLTALEFA